jgi:argininosuccinate synthase
MQPSDALVPKYSELVYKGFWFSPERKALQALVTEPQRDVTGLVRPKLYKGNIVVAGQKLRVNPILDPLHADPRFEKIVASLTFKNRANE